MSSKGEYDHAALTVRLDFVDLVPAKLKAPGPGMPDGVRIQVEALVEHILQGHTQAGHICELSDLVDLQIIYRCSC